MPDLKQINEEALVARVRDAEEYALRRVREAAARALADVQEAARALAALSQTEALMAQATAYVVGEMSFGAPNTRGDVVLNRVTIDTSDGFRQISLYDGGSGTKLPFGAYRAIVLLLPLDGVKDGGR